MFKPPWARITALDLGKGEIAWQVALGDGPRDHPRLAHLDLPPLGSGGHSCVVVTGSLLIAAEGGAGTWSPHGRPILRAFDKATGASVGEVAVPSMVRGCPMTYLHAGVQYIVVPVGAPFAVPELVALALPARPVQP